MNETLGISIGKAVLTKAPTLFVKTRLIRDVYVTYASPDIEQRKYKLIEQWSGKTQADLDSLPLVRVYRELQRQLGGDSNEMLPAVEGLLTRGLLQGRFPKVNSLVDAANTVSVKNLVPIGLFDCDKIVGDIELALAIPGDQFIPIGKDKPVRLSPGTPILKDAEGIFSAVGSRDSKRTMISSNTTNVLAFSWGIQGIEASTVSAVLDQCADELLK
jgi:DNA/RNA-binding domain of Phe-tRNA-synthetase-like protein